MLQLSQLSCWNQSSMVWTRLFALGWLLPLLGYALDHNGHQAQIPLGGVGSTGDAASSSPRKPNIVFVITDDQDLHLQSLEYMPLVKKHLLDQGTFYKRHFCTIALCCPSRVSLWTGKAAHNTNVTDVKSPYGKLHNRHGLNCDWLTQFL